VADRNGDDEDEQHLRSLTLVDQRAGAPDSLEVHDHGHRRNLEDGDDQGAADAERPAGQAGRNDRERQLRTELSAEKRECERIAEGDEDRTDREQALL
jgi:hypothetical protein